MRRRPRMRSAIGVAVFWLFAAACTGDYSTTPTTEQATPSPSSTTPPSALPDPDAPPVPGGDPELVIELGGTLAVTVEHLVVTVGPDGENVELVDGGIDGIASQPVWSRDGSRLAWTHIGPEGESVGIQSEDGEIIYSTAIGSPPFYLQWNFDGQRLSYLRTTPAPEPSEEPDADEGEDSGAGSVEAGLVDPGAPLRSLATGSPFYLSWAPDRDEIVALRNENELLYLSEENGALTLPDGAGPYTVPVWSGPDTIILSDANSINELNIETGERRGLASVPGRVRFVLSPDQTRLAYSPANDGLLPGEHDQLIMLDIESGEERLVTEGFILAWEWSPNSESLAWLAPATTAEVDLVALQRARFTWSFWTDGEVETGPSYLPSTTAARSYLPFFEQFAQSHKRWSPGSNAFAFSGSIDGFDGIWIQVVGHAETPVYLTPGDAVTWGPADAGGNGGSIL